MISVKNEKTIETLNDLLFERKIDGSAIRSIEIMRVNSSGKAERLSCIGIDCRNPISETAGQSQGKEADL